MKAEKLSPDASELGHGVRTDRLQRAFDRLRIAALALDVARQAMPAREVRAARAILSRTLTKTLVRLRHGTVLAEIAMEGSEPELGAVVLLIELDKAALQILAWLPRRPGVTWRKER